MTIDTLRIISNKKYLIECFDKHDIFSLINVMISIIVVSTRKHMNYFTIPLEQYETNTLTVIIYTKCVYYKCIHKSYIIQFEVSPRITKYKLLQKALRTDVNREAFENNNLYIQKVELVARDRIYNAKQLYIFINTY